MTTGRLTDAVRRLSDRVRADARSDLPDGHLLTLFIEHRDAIALEALVRRHGPMVMGVCRRLLGNEPDAEDAFQATFLVLVRKARSVRPRERVGHWLYGVARTTAVRAKAARAKRHTREGPLMDAPDATTTEPTAGGELLALLDQEIGRLPEKYRLPIVLCELGGRSHKDAADQLGWPIGTLSGRLSRGRQMLADRLARRGVPLTAAALTASVPGSLTAETVRLAAGGLVPDRLLTLTDGVVKAMLVNKLKVTVPVLMAAIACGTVGVAYRPLAADEPAKPVEKKADAEPKLDHIQKFNFAIEKDKAALQGMWVKVSGWGNVGGDVAQLNDLIGDMYLFVDGDRFEMFAKDGGKLQKSTGLDYPTSMHHSDKFEVNPNTVPKQFNLWEPDGDAIYGIYSLDGDRLVVCGQKGEDGRPRTFDRGKGDAWGKISITFQRSKDTPELREQRRAARATANLVEGIEKLTREDPAIRPNESAVDYLRRHAGTLDEIDRIVQAMRTKAQRELKETETRSEPRNGGSR